MRGAKKLTTSELRLGNYLKIDGIVVVVFQLTRDHVWCEYFCSKEPSERHDPTEIEPILLNKDWLVSFGFQDTPDGLVKDFGFFKLCFEDMIPYYHNGVDWAILTSEIKDSLKYVHQLQNMSFVLTGKELTKNC